MGIIRLSFLPFSFEPKALAEPAPTLVPWPKKNLKKKKWRFLLVDGCHCGYITKLNPTKKKKKKHHASSKRHPSTTSIHNLSHNSIHWMVCW
jgi:hypothetical protein